MRKAKNRQKAIIEALKAVQKRLGLSGRKMSGRLGRAHNFISEVYRGQHRLYLDEFLDMCEKLDVSTHEVIEMILKG